MSTTCSSLSDLFGEDSCDEFIPCMSSEDSGDGLNPSCEQQRKKKCRFYNYSHLAKKKRLNFDETQQPSTSTAEEQGEDILPLENSRTLGNGQDINQEESNTERTQGLDQTPKKPRKIVANPLKWKCNVRKIAHQTGKSYLSKRGKNVAQRSVKTLKNCNLQCKFKCFEKISEAERSDLHDSYYSLQTASEKRHFLIQTTSRFLTARPKRMNVEDQVPSTEEIEGDELMEDDELMKNEGETGEKNVSKTTGSRRKFTFQYVFFVKGEKVRVCKSFYLGTLSISQKPVYTAHETKNMEMNTPNPDKRGKNKNSRRVPVGNPEVVKEHIKSFPLVESHYCRAHTTREYLGSHLSIGKMYELYLKKCCEENLIAVRKSMYYRIFVTQFNLGFHVPKSDRCDLCEKYKVAKQTETMTDKIQYEYDVHQTSKSNMREVRKEEKNKQDFPVLLFDLENVILTPHANISSLFYLRKLNIYNLTAYYTPTKQVYCALWSENLSGRAGNDIASAFYKILTVLADENDLTELTTWSDSCVPQNRNSIISNAVMHFLKENHQVTSVTMKYSLPGHSCVQEIDSVHSAIERAMNKNDFFSPIGLIRILKQISPRNPYRVIQMQRNDFIDFQGTSKLLNYRAVPFTSVAVLKFTRTLHTVNYKSSHDKFEPENSANIKIGETPERKAKKQTKKTISECKSLNVFQVTPKLQKPTKGICDDKKKDIKTAFPFMPIQDIIMLYSMKINYSMYHVSTLSIRNKYD